MDRPAGALRVGRSWLVVFRGRISRAGLIDRGILMRLCGNPVREGNRRLLAGPSAGLRCPLSFLSRQLFSRRARNFFDRSKKLLDNQCSGGVSVHPMLSGKRLPRVSSFSG